MKKTIILVSLFLSVQSFAQEAFKKGNFYAGVYLDLSSDKNQAESKVGSTTVEQDPVKNMNFTFNPEFSYFIIDNLALGLNVGFQTMKEERTNNGQIKTEITDKASGPVFGLYGRKYWSCTDNLSTFAGIGFNLSLLNGSVESKANNVTTKTESKYTNRSLGLNAGFAYSVSQRVLLLGSFAILSFYSNIYKSQIVGDDYNQNKYSGFSLDINNRSIPFNMGFIYLLNPNKKN